MSVMQRAFRESGLTPTELARRLGWMQSGDSRFGDGYRVSRTLGLKKQTKPPRYSRYVRYDTAVRMIRAMGFDPIDWGL